MAVFSAMMVGTVAGVAVLGTTIVSLARLELAKQEATNKQTTNQQILDPATLSFARRSNNSQNPPRRQRASVTEVSRPHSLTKGSSTPNTIKGFQSSGK